MKERGGQFSFVAFAALLFFALTQAAWGAIASNGTVVVATAGSADKIKVVGTSRITVMSGTTVDDLKARIVASDNSPQTYTVLDATNAPKASGAIVTGDNLSVTAANGVKTSAYALAIYDPTAKARDGVYWNEDVYNQIDSTVNANIPIFRDVDYVIIDPKYAGLVTQVTDGIGQTSSSVVWYYGDAIKAAIADANADGGGRVVIPANGSLNSGGNYYSGAINMLSNVNLYVETGATLKFLRNPTNTYYPVVLTSHEGTDFYNYSPAVYALNQTNLGISGGGTLDFQVNVATWRLPTGIAGAPSGSNTVLNNWNYQDVPFEQRIMSDDGHMPDTIPVIVGNTVQNVAPPAGATAYKTTFTPNFIEFNHSKNILIEGVKFTGPLFWMVHPLNSQNILVRDTIVLDTNHLTDDGVDPESCSYVVMERNNITVLDDGTAIKSGRNLNGRKSRDPSQYMIVRDTAYSNPSGGSASISMGSENSGGVRWVFAENNTHAGNGTAYLLKIKMNAYRGGVVSDIYVRNSTMTQTIRGIVNWDSNFSESVPFTNADVFNPTIRNVYVDNVNTTPSVTTTFQPYVISSAVSRSPIENTYYRNSVFHTTSTFDAAFSSNTNKFFKNFNVQNVTVINRTTGAQTVYNTIPLKLLDQTQAIVGSKTVPLTAASIDSPLVINRLPGSSFAISGKVDLSSDPNFMTAGAVRVYVDRSTTAIPVTLNPDGSFTSGNITLNDNQFWYADPPEQVAFLAAPLPTDITKYWYSDRHYVTIQFNDGMNMNTLVYQVSNRLLGDTNVDGSVGCPDLTTATTAIGKRAGQTGFIPAADLDSNGVIDVRDISAISRLLPAGTRCP
jgi:polygalacturonase